MLLGEIMNVQNWSIVDEAGQMVAPHAAPLIFRGTFGEKTGIAQVVGYDLQEQAYISAEGELYRLGQIGYNYKIAFPDAEKTLIKLPRVYRVDILHLEGR